MKSKPIESRLAALLAAVAFVLAGAFALSFISMDGAYAADATNYDYDATATPAELKTMPGVYHTQVQMNTGTDPQTIGIPSVAKQNLENGATKEMPAIIQGAAVNYEVKTGPIDFTPIGGKELLPPYSYFRYKYMEKEEKDPDGTVRKIKTLTGFDGSYYIVRVDISKIIEAAQQRAEANGETLDGKYLHVLQQNNKALLTATGMTDYSYVWANTNQTGDKAAAYSLANNAEAMKDTSGNDNQTPYLDVILMSSAKNVAGADAGGQSAPTSNVDLTFYVDDTKDYKPWLHALDPNNMPTFPYTITYEGKEYKYQDEATYNQELQTKFFETTKATAENGLTKYRAMGEDLEIDVAVNTNQKSAEEGPDFQGGVWIGMNMDFWSMEKAIAENKYDSHIIIMICEVPVLNGMTISGSKDRSVVLDVNSFDIQIANHTTEGKAGLTIGENAVLRIMDGTKTSGAELAIGNNATMVIEKGGTMIIDESCTAEAEFDAASTVDPATDPAHYQSGEITVQEGGSLINHGVINIEGTEGKPLDPSQPEQPTIRDKQSADILVEYGGLLDNYGVISLKGTLHILGMLNNYGKYNDILKAFDPDKNVIEYHRGIQVTWKDDVTQEGVVPGALFVGIDLKGNIQKDAVLNNYGDIVLCPGIFTLYGTFNNAKHPDPDANYAGHLYLCTADEAVIPIVNPTDPAVVVKRVTLDPPKESVFDQKNGIVNNDGGVIDSARVEVVNNGLLGKLTPSEEEIADATKAITEAKTAVTNAQKAMDDLLATENPSKEDIKAAYDAVVKAQNALTAANQRLSTAEKAKAKAQLTALEGQVNELTQELAEVSVVDISNYAATLAKTSYVYTGKAIKPAVTVSGLTAADYTVTYTNNTAIGTATVTIQGKAERNFKGKIVKTFKITKKAAAKKAAPAKAANPLAVKGKTVKIKRSKLKKKTQKLAVKKVIKFTKKGQGTMRYSLVSAKKGSKSFKKIFKVNAKTGKVTIKKNTKMKKGTYKVKIKVKAAGNAKYKPSAWKTVTVKIKVK